MPLSFSRLFFLTSLAALFTACASAPPPVRKAQQNPEELEQSAEWLFATEQGSRVKDAKEECEKVASFLLGEKNCTSDLCIHARDLGKDWTRRCAKQVPDRVSEVREFIAEMERRSELSADACTTQAKSLLQTSECGTAEQCRDASQRWVSRCGDRYATPLVLLMLTKKTERRFSEATDVTLDTRTCKILQEKMKAAFGCDGEEACKDGIEAATAWKARCFDENLRPAMDAAFTFASVMVGANQGVDALLIDVSTESALPSSFALGLRDGKGAALWVCGERPKNIVEYLDVRGKCAPGEVIFARIDGKHQVKTVSVPHKSDTDFLRIFPFLELRGEQDARDIAALPAFKLTLKQAEELSRGKKPADAIGKLLGILSNNSAAIARREEYREALKEVDLGLAPSFKEWGKAKAKAASKVRDATEFVAFVGRSMSSPVMDTSPDGSIVPGTGISALNLNLAQWLPVSYSAYQEQVSRLEKEAKRKKPNEVKISSMRSSLATDIRACGVAEAETQKAIEKAALCLFEEASCSPAQAAAISMSADSARHTANQARKTIAGVLSSGLLPRSEVERYESERIAAGCLDL